MSYHVHIPTSEKIGVVEAAGHLHVVVASIPGDSDGPVRHQENKQQPDRGVRVQAGSFVRGWLRVLQRRTLRVVENHGAHCCVTWTGLEARAMVPKEGNVWFLSSTRSKKRDRRVEGELACSEQRLLRESTRSYPANMAQELASILKSSLIYPEGFPSRPHSAKEPVRVWSPRGE